MSNLKKDIEKILKDFVLWRTKIIDGKPVATYDKNMLSEWENKNMLSEWEREQYQPMEAVTQIINLVEESEQKLLAKMTLESKVLEGRIKELEMLPIMRKALHTPQKDLDIILVDTVNNRIKQLKRIEELTKQSEKSDE